MRMPSWLRPSIRLRLVALCGGLIVVAGALILTLNYVLVANHLLVNTPDLRRKVESELRLPRGILLPAPLPRELRSDPEGEGRVIKGRRILDPAKSGEIDLGGGTRKVSIARVLSEFEDELRRDILGRLVRQSLYALGVLGLLSVLIGAIVARRFLKPVKEITTAAHRLSEENLHERIGMRGPQDELKELADTFDSMLERLDSAFRSQRNFVANASHELRTPLTVMQTQIEVTDKNSSNEELRKTLRIVAKMVERNERLIDSLLMLAKTQGSVRRERVAVHELVERASDRIRDPASRKSIDLSFDLDHECRVMGDPILLERLVVNLLENAVAHNVEEGWIATSLCGDRGKVILQIENSGPLITTEAESLFQPFHRAGGRRSDGVNGFGLGLSIVRAVAESHGGRAEGRVRPAGGLTVTVELDSAASTGPAGPPAKRKEKLQEPPPVLSN